MNKIYLNVCSKPNGGFNAEMDMTGDRDKLVIMLAAMFCHDEEVKDVFAEAVYKSSHAVSLPTPQPNNQLTLIEN